MSINTTSSRPGEILDELNQRIIHTLRQRQGGSKSQDGMDISLAIFEKGSMVMKYSGAVNPIYLVRPGEEDIIKLETDFNIIGSSLVKRPKPFKSRTFHLREDDLLYFFSDGYPDQFGGEEGIEKLKKSRFKNYLLKIQSLAMEDQKEKLITYFHQWRGEVEQFDDILVVGIKVGKI